MIKDVPTWVSQNVWILRPEFRIGGWLPNKANESQNRLQLPDLLRPAFCKRVSIEWVANMYGTASIAGQMRQNKSTDIHCCIAPTSSL